MNGLCPGDRIVYRDGECFGVARVDLVKDRHVTAFPFDPTNRRWSRRNRRIGHSFVIGKLPPREAADRIALRIERLRHQHEAQRQIAKRQFELSVCELIRSGTPQP